MRIGSTRWTMGYVLRSVRGRKQGMAIPVKRKVFLIGSSPKSQIRSRKEGIGPQHCALIVRKKKLYIQDLRSGFPTHVNGLTVTPGGRLLLKKGDRVAMGPMEFAIEFRRKRRPAAVLVSAPFAAPPVPVGRPVTQRPMGPVAVPVNEALAAPAFLFTPVQPRPEGRIWTLAAVAALAVVGLGLGLLISRAFLNRAEDPIEDRDDNRMARREDRDADRALPQDKNRQAAKGQGEQSIVPPQGPKDFKQDQLPRPIGDDKPKEVRRKDPPAPEKVPVDEKKKPEAKAETKKPEPKDLPKENPVKAQVAFAEHVMPILVARCVNCHAGAKKKGGLDVSSIASMLKGGDTGPAIVAGDLEKSPLWMRVDDDTMPVTGKPLTMAEKKILQGWIAGATNGTFTK